jgi:replicative DNA helicase
MSLYEYDGEDKVILSTDMAEIIKNQPKAKFTLDTGIQSLTEALGGFRSGDLVTITGLTGNGKTLLARTFTNSLTLDDVMCCWFCFENLMDDFLKSFGDIMPIFSLPSKLINYDPMWIEERIREAKEKYEAKVFFIDHLHYMLNIFTLKSPSLAIGQLMRDLKTLAVELQICIVIIAHTTKIKIDKDETELELADIRDSSFIGQESDTCLLIWRVKEEKGAILKVGKSRHTGIIKKIKLVKGFDGFLREVYE